MLNSSRTPDLNHSAPEPTVTMAALGANLSHHMSMGGRNPIYKHTYIYTHTTNSSILLIVHSKINILASSTMIMISINK